MRTLRTVVLAVVDGASESDHVACGPALSLARHLQQAVMMQQLLVEGAHVAAGEGMQRLAQQTEALGSLQPVFVAVVVQTLR